MLGMGPTLRISLAEAGKELEEPCGLVRRRLATDPLSGHLCCFCNRRRTRLKCLYLDGSRLWVRGKRLERESFRWPSAEETAAVRQGAAEWALLLGALQLPACLLRARSRVVHHHFERPPFSDTPHRLVTGSCCGSEIAALLPSCQIDASAP